MGSCDESFKPRAGSRCAAHGTTRSWRLYSHRRIGRPHEPRCSSAQGEEPRLRPPGRLGLEDCRSEFLRKLIRFTLAYIRQPPGAVMDASVDVVGTKHSRVRGLDTRRSGSAGESVRTVHREPFDRTRERERRGPRSSRAVKSFSRRRRGRRSQLEVSRRGGRDPSCAVMTRSRRWSARAGAIGDPGEEMHETKRCE